VATRRGTLADAGQIEAGRQAVEVLGDKITLQLILSYSMNIYIRHKDQI
jgi:hypothetical protein